MFYTNLQTNAVIGILLVLAALGALLLANLVFLRLYCKYFGDDMDFVKWEAKHYCINKVFVVFGGCISFKVHRMLYSKVMDRD
jgi:Na+/H+ antiporter NhaA